MRLGKYGKVFHHDRIEIGEGHIDRFTLFEFKPCAALIFNRFNTIRQDRFHTHAFNSWSLMLCGEYHESITNGGRTWGRTRKNDLVYLPRTLNHKILLSTPNAWSITICGPWAKTWTETTREEFGGADIEKTYTWGREKIK